MQAVDTKINGIDVEALKQTMAAISEDPQRGNARFHVKTNWRNGTKSDTRVDHWEIGGERKPRGYTIQTDEPMELLGSNSAPNPQEVLMAGLNACMAVGYVANCAVRGIDLVSLSIETEGNLDLRGFLALDPGIKPGYDEIRYTVRIKGNGTTEQFQEIHESVMATSPNYFNMANPIRLVPRLVID